MNPYRVAEWIGITLVALIVIAVLAFFAWIITITESWKGVGIVALVVAVFFVAAILYDEAESIGDWWVRKREAWDAKHSPTSENA